MRTRVANTDTELSPLVHSRDTLPEYLQARLLKATDTEETQTVTMS